MTQQPSRLTFYAPFLLGGLALVVYLFTLAPGLSWGHAYFGRQVGLDGGDFVTAAWFWGVPHPTGYPTYTLLAGVLARLPWGSVPWRVNLLSAVAGAATVALLYLLGRRLAREGAERRAAGGAAVGALLLAFAPLFWSHALVAEVYTLHLFFVALVFWLTQRWRDGAGALWPAALAFGLGMGNHITLVFMGPLIALTLWGGRRRLSGRGVLLAALALAAGLTVYVYLPWRAAADPVVNWGDPDTWEGFRWVIGGQGYRRFFFPAERRYPLSPRLEDWWWLTAAQFVPLAWPLAALGLWALARRERWLALGTFLHAAINLVYAVGYDVSDAFVHLLPLFFYVALWMGGGATALLAAVDRWCRGGPRWVDRRATLVVGLVAVGLFCLPFVSLIQEWPRMDLTRDREAQDYAQKALQVVEPGALILTSSDNYTFPLWYYRYVEGLRPDVLVVNDSMLSFEWYRHTVSGYHPEMVLPGPEANRVTKLDLVLRNLDQRAVYITDDEENLPGLELTPVGPLWRVTTR